MAKKAEGSAAGSKSLALNNEKLYRALVEGIPGIVYSFSLKHGGVYYSPHTLQALGYSPEQLYAQPLLWRNSIHPDDLPLVAQAVSEAAKGVLFSIEYRIRDAHGGWRWFNDRSFSCQADGADTIIEGLALDITERKQAEEARKESEKRFMDVLYASSDAILLIDGTNFIDCNEATQRMTGYDDKSAFLMTHPSALSPSTQPDGKSSLEKADEMMRTARANGFHQFEWTHRKADGEDFPVQVSLTPIRMNGKNLIHCVWRDLTVHKKNELALANVQKLESLGVLAGGIAHDFNNVLTAILGNLSLLQSEIKPGGEAQEILTEAQKACATAKGLSNQLLTFSKAESLSISVVDLRPVLTEAAVFAARGTNVRCVFELGESPLAAAVDKEQISRVVQNLIINAAQAMQKGGDIALRASPVTLGANERPGFPAGLYIRLTVEDQGPGIPSEHLTRIFDPYFSTKAVGRGLGLAMCYSIMAKHGGCISADSKPGSGAVFTLHFPAASNADITAEKKKAPITTGSGKVLIMEDDPPLAKVLKRILERLGYGSDIVSDGQAALDAYRREMTAGKPYDAVIMDLTIAGGMGGEETIGKLKALDPEAKAIVSSGYANNPIISDYAASGFSAALCKPYNMEQVSEALRRALGRS
jgi:PAS domain S-box-containing protein